MNLRLSSLHDGTYCRATTRRARRVVLRRTTRRFQAVCQNHYSPSPPTFQTRWKISPEAERDVSSSGHFFWGITCFRWLTGPSGPYYSLWSSLYFSPTLPVGDMPPSGLKATSSGYGIHKQKSTQQKCWVLKRWGV